MNAAERPCLLHRILALAAALLLLGNLFLSPALGLHAQAEEISSPQKLRVGYYAYTGFNMIDADGSYSGYSYELLQKIARYRNVIYEYDGYDSDVNDVMQMLEDGEIDVIPNLRITPDREDRFDFTTSPVGTIASMLTVRAGNCTVIAGEYSTYNGMTVGFSHDGNGRNQSFIEFAADHNFTYTPVFYDTDDELAKALHKREITAALTNANRITTDEWVLETFDETPFYMAVRKGDTQTLALLNGALAEMDRQEPSWQVDLHERYSSTSRSSTLALTAEEQAYLYDTNAGGKVWAVAVNPDRYPYSYKDQKGNWTGISVKLFDLLARRAGIYYRLLDADTRDDYMDLLQNGKADLSLAFFNDLSHAEQLGYKLTDPYLSAGFSWVRLRRDTEMQTIGTVGLLAKEAFGRLENMPQVTIAAVNGYALGGGCELAMSCDIRVAAENAVFGQPECGLGIIPGFGGTQRLARLVGKGRAKELIFTCDRIDAQEAYRIGLANKVVAKDALLDECRAMAGRILSKGSYAISLAKASIESGMDTDLASGLGLEATNFGLSFATHDKKEGMTAFLEKRKEKHFSGQ